MNKLELIQKVGDEVCEGCGPDADCGYDPLACSRLQSAMELVDEYISNHASQPSVSANGADAVCSFKDDACRLGPDYPCEICRIKPRT